MKIANDQLRESLGDFVRSHPQGWGHHQWEGLLADLSESGVDVSDAEGIGAALEAERLETVLGDLGVKGLGPKRRQTVVERYGRLWDLSQASVDELSELPSFHKGLATSLHQALH